MTGQGCNFGGFYHSMTEDSIPFPSVVIMCQWVIDCQERQYHIPEEQSLCDSLDPSWT